MGMGEMMSTQKHDVTCVSGDRCPSCAARILRGQAALPAPALPITTAYVAVVRCEAHNPGELHRELPDCKYPHYASPEETIIFTRHQAPITTVTNISPRDNTVVCVTPPRPCAFSDCVGELQVAIGHDSLFVHLNDAQRRELIVALGGRADG